MLDLVIDIINAGVYNFGSNKIEGRILKLPLEVKEFKQIYGKSANVKIEKKSNNIYLLANIQVGDVILINIKFDIW